MKRKASLKLLHHLSHDITVKKKLSLTRPISLILTGAGAFHRRRRSSSLASHNRTSFLLVFAFVFCSSLNINGEFCFFAGDIPATAVSVRLPHTLLFSDRSLSYRKSLNRDFLL
jgi:hypothetical protein